MTLQRELAWQQIELLYRSSVAHQFARYALSLDYSMIPPEVVHQAKRCLLDTLGCAIGAYPAPAAEIVTRDGRRLHKRVDVPHGVGNDPLSDAELETKFRELASPYMSEAQASVLVEACWRTETLEDVGQLAKLMVFDAACRQRTGGAL